MRNTFVRNLCELSRKDKRIILLTGDLGYGALDEYRKVVPMQFINTGIAEQNMTSLAAGMAISGHKVFTYSIGNFNSIRCVEQIRNDICYHNLDVKIVSIGAGIAYGSAGITHHLTEDISIMRSIPNLMVFSPSDKNEVELITEFAYKENTPCYIRLGKGGEEDIHSKKLDFVKIGDLIEVKKGKDICIISTGSISIEAYKAVKDLEEQGVKIGLFTVPTIKPLNYDMLVEISNSYKTIFTLEENMLNGGLGSAILEVLSDNGILKSKVVRLGINNIFTSHIGDVNHLRKYYNIDTDSIKNRILKEINGD